MLVFGMEIPVMELLFNLLMAIFVLMIIMIITLIINLRSVIALRKVILVQRGDLESLEEIVSKIPFMNKFPKNASNEILSHYIGQSLNEGFLPSEIVKKLVESGHEEDHVKTLMKAELRSKNKNAIKTVTKELQQGNNWTKIAPKLKSETNSGEEAKQVKDYFQKLQ